MSQGYGPEDPNQPGQGESPSHPPPPSYGQPGYGPPPNQGGYPPQPDQGGYGQPGYGPPPPGAYPPPQSDPPGYYMGHQLASWAQRMGAYLIDGAAYFVLFVILIVVSAISGPNDSGTVALIVWLLFLVGVGIWVYNRCILAGRTGQSWGKQALGLKLLRMDNGQPIGGGMACLRDFAHLLDFLPCYVGFLWPLWDNRRQTFADKVITTVVIAD